MAPTRRRQIIRFAIVSVCFSACLAAPAALADCFEDLGQTGCPSDETFPVSDLRRLSCENLWLVRNSVYNAKGLCFASERGKEQFDNSDCFVTDAGSIQLNGQEQANVDAIRQIEKEFECR